MSLWFWHYLHFPGTKGACSRTWKCRFASACIHCSAVCASRCCCPLPTVSTLCGRLAAGVCVWGVVPRRLPLGAAGGALGSSRGGAQLLPRRSSSSSMRPIPPASAAHRRCICGTRSSARVVALGGFGGGCVVPDCRSPVCGCAPLLCACPGVYAGVRVDRAPPPALRRRFS